MSKISILIVEDEGIIAEDIAGKVRGLGYDVAGTTATGEEAVEFARRHQPALVLMDIWLAGAMDGIEAAQEIHRTCYIPVVFLTANSDTATVERAQEAGALGYILKPLGERDLRIQIEMALYKHAAERRIRESEERLQALNEDLELRVELRTRELQETQKQCLHAEKLAAIGRLSASIAHEFNNPLQGILSVLKGLKKRATMEEVDRRLLLAAIGEGDRIKGLIRSLQDFNRPSSGKKTIMDVHKTLDSILLLNKSDYNSRRISVMQNYAENLPQIMAVTDQIKQVFLNLLTNAADSCHERGGVVTISTQQENNSVTVAIQDTGIGIKPSEMEHIFQPFYSTKPEVKGTGLGLSVSYGIINQHHGEIRVESKPGEGATFTVMLPIKSPHENASTIDG